MMPSVPTPAAARYMRAGEHSPPAPTQSTLAFFSRFCPSIATSWMIKSLEELLISSGVSDSAGSTSAGSDTVDSPRLGLETRDCLHRQASHEIATGPRARFFPPPPMRQRLRVPDHKCRSPLSG